MTFDSKKPIHIMFPLLYKHTTYEPDPLFALKKI